MSLAGLARHRVLAVIIVVSASLRLALYFRRHSLWIDEAWLALNIVGRSFRGLMGSLDYNQSAPLLFLWAQKTMVVLFGANELALRTVPLMAGVAAVALIYRAGSPLVGRSAATVAAILAAISPTLVDYSNQNKQYAVETLATAILLFAVGRWAERRTTGRMRGILWSGVLAIWLSAPALFVLAAIGIGVLCGEPSDRKEARRLAVRAIPLWSISFVAAYALVYRYAAESAYMHRFWQPMLFVPGTPDFGPRARFALDSVVWGILVGREPNPGMTLADQAFIWSITGLVLCVVIVGAAAVARRNRTVAYVLCAPLMLAIVASLLGRYPIILRTLLFAAPLLFLLVGAGVVHLWTSSSKPALILGALAVVVMAAVPGVLVVRDLAITPPREHLRPLLELEWKQRHAGDVTYVSAGALPAYTFYTTDWAMPDTARLSWLKHIGRAGGVSFQNTPSRGHPVEREGDALVRQGPHGVELFGVFNGIEAASYTMVTERADSGWAVNEANRIRTAMRGGDAWLVMSHLFRAELALVDELRRDHHVDLTPSGYRSVLVHVHHD